MCPHILLIFKETPKFKGQSLTKPFLRRDPISVGRFPDISELRENKTSEKIISIPNGHQRKTNIYLSDDKFSFDFSTINSGRILLTKTNKTNNFNSRTRSGQKSNKLYKVRNAT